MPDQDIVTVTVPEGVTLHAGVHPSGFAAGATVALTRRTATELGLMPGTKDPEPAAPEIVVEHDFGHDG